MQISFLPQARVKIYEILRDWIITHLPLRTLPEVWVTRLYGFRPDFIFLIHPRNIDDLYKFSSLLKRIRSFIPERVILRLFSLTPCYVIGHIVSDTGARGLIVSTAVPPIQFFSDKLRALQTLGKTFRFIGKLSKKEIYVGLGAWWPIITNNGLDCEELLGTKLKKKIIVTNGHCATLASIILTINKISNLSHYPVNKLEVLIIGVGRMGSALSHALNGAVKKIGLIDRNQDRCALVESQLNGATRKSAVYKVTPKGSCSFEDLILEHVQKYSLTVCTTSNFGYVISDAGQLKNCIIVDDSRPEAFPRLVNRHQKAVVIEGGLIKINGIHIDQDFGFGTTNNIFGCLAEVLLLAADRGKLLRPAVGDVDGLQIEQMLEFFRRHNIREGDLLSGYKEIDPKLISEIVTMKNGFHSGKAEILTTPQNLL